MLPDNTSISNPTLIIHLSPSGGAVTIHDRYWVKLRRRQLSGDPYWEEWRTEGMMERNGGIHGIF